MCTGTLCTQWQCAHTSAVSQSQGPQTQRQALNMCYGVTSRATHSRQAPSTSHKVTRRAINAGAPLSHKSCEAPGPQMRGRPTSLQKSRGGPQMQALDCHTNDVKDRNCWHSTHLT
eukprot:1141761-Pelagomonas_calceolata.AAC.3